MSMTLGEIITAVRDQHPSFDDRSVTDPMFARHFSAYQRRLVSKATGLNSDYLAQRASVIFDVESTNAPGTAGAGTVGGFPALASPDGSINRADKSVGLAMDIDVAHEDTVVDVAEFVPTSVTNGTLTLSTASWSVNAYANKYIWVKGGTGIGEIKQIASNTATVLTLTNNFTINPDTTSICVIVTPVINADTDRLAVTDLSQTRTDTSYLVRVDATGTPYIDLTKPLLAKFSEGIPLPANEYLLGGTVRFKNTDVVFGELGLTKYSNRHMARGNYPAYVQGNELFLIGVAKDWDEVKSVDLRYVPITDLFTALTDVFLLPDNAYDVLIAAGAAFGAKTASPDSYALYTGELQQAEAVFLHSVGHLQAAGPHYVKEVW